MASVSSLSSRSVTSSGISHVQFVDGDGEGQVGRGSRVISQPSAPNGIHSHPPGGKSVFGSTQSSFESRHSASPESPRLPAMAFARCDALDFGSASENARGLGVSCDREPKRLRN